MDTSTRRALSVGPGAVVQLGESDKHGRSPGVLGLEPLIKYSEGESKSQVEHEVLSHSRYIREFETSTGVNI